MYQLLKLSLLCVKTSLSEITAVDIDFYSQYFCARLIKMTRVFCFSAHVQILTAATLYSLLFYLIGSCALKMKRMSLPNVH